MKIVCEKCSHEQEIKIGALMQARFMETTTKKRRKEIARKAGIASGIAKRESKIKKLSTVK